MNIPLIVVVVIAGIVALLIRIQRNSPEGRKFAEMRRLDREIERANIDRALARKRREAEQALAQHAREVDEEIKRLLSAHCVSATEPDSTIPMVPEKLRQDA